MRYDMHSQIKSILPSCDKWKDVKRDLVCTTVDLNLH